MNPQPEANITNFFAILSMLYMLYHFTKAYNDPEKHIELNDNFTLGYISDVDLKPIKQRVCTKQSSPKKKAPEPKKPKQKPPVEKTKKKPKKKIYHEYNQLEQDCFDALISLGFKKKEATFTVNTEFSKDNPAKTIQEFLSKSLNRPQQ